MNFQRNRHRDEPEINFIPLIDLLLVILIFFVVTTTYSRFAELQINLPQAQANEASKVEHPLNVAIDSRGQFMLNNQPLVFSDVEQLATALRKEAAGNPDPTVVINADAKALHQSVVDVMEAARQAGYTRLTFATQTPAAK